MTPQEQWLAYLRVERGRSENTMQTYEQTGDLIAPVRLVRIREILRDEL